MRENARYVVMITGECATRAIGQCRCGVSLPDVNLAVSHTTCQICETVRGLAVTNKSRVSIGLSQTVWANVGTSKQFWSAGAPPFNNNNNNNSNSNNQISIAPYGLNFRGAGGRSDQCSVKAWLNSKVLNLDLKTVRESLMRTVCGREFQTVGAENWKARLEKSVLMNGWSSSGMTDERKFGCRQLGGVGKPEWMCSELWDGNVTDPKNKPLPVWVSMSNLIAVGIGLRTTIHRKNLDLCVRPFKVTEGHQKGSIEYYGFLLVMHCNYENISYLSETKCDVIRRT